MKKLFLYRQGLLGGLLGIALLLGACHSAYRVTQVEGRQWTVDATLDAHPNAEAAALLAPYKQRVDSMMNHVVGEAACDMDRNRPEGPLSNLVADVLRQAAIPVLGRPADIGVINIGGVRNSLTKGPITVGHIYEILPFENSLCVLTLRGDVLKRFLGEVGRRSGEGMSGVHLVIAYSKGKSELKSCDINGRPIDDKALYTLATVDYLAEGNDGMPSLCEAEERACHPELTVRELFMRYVEQEQAAGRKISARLEQRVEWVEP